MAHSSLAVPASNNKINGTKQGSMRSNTAANRTRDNFAALMAREQNKTTAQKSASTQTRPQVARLPDTGGIPLRNNTILAGRSPNDMLRMQNLGKAAAAASAQDGDTNLRTIAAGGNGKGFALNSNDFIHTRNTSHIARTSRIRKQKTQITESSPGLGKLSARFESGSDGIAAIGYDGTGGTSYGKYQIASKVGSMKSFLNFLDSEAPDIASRLRNSGPANTGSRRGAMPDTWRAIAKEQPERFEQLQEAFIHQSHYKPALAAIEAQTGLDTSDLSAAMREVIWSTAVQHGPAGAARIFARADGISGTPKDANYERKLITNVYKMRAGQFGSSTAQVREAVRNRFKQEQQLALNLLDQPAKANLT